MLKSGGLGLILAVLFSIILLAGVFQALFGLTRLGTVIRFIPQPVMSGFQNSAALLLQSANDKHPDGLANSSGKVGKNLMFNGQTAAFGYFEHPLNEYKSVQVTRIIHDFYDSSPRRGFYGGGGSGEDDHHRQRHRRRLHPHHGRGGRSHAGGALGDDGPPDRLPSHAPRAPPRGRQLPQLHLWIVIVLCYDLAGC